MNQVCINLIFNIVITGETFRQIALSFREATEQPHFDTTSFRIGKKIFATLNVADNTACIKLSEIDQNVFSAFDKTVIFPVPNKWGKQGWTFINLNTVHKDMLVDALKTAYAKVTSKTSKNKQNK